MSVGGEDKTPDSNIDVNNGLVFRERHWKALGKEKALPLADGEEQHACLVWYTVHIWNTQLRLRPHSDVRT